jgi:hypothetical protein
MTDPKDEPFPEQQKPGGLRAILQLAVGESLADRIWRAIATVSAIVISAKAVTEWQSPSVRWAAYAIGIALSAASLFRRQSFSASSILDASGKAVMVPTPDGTRSFRAFILGALAIMLMVDLGYYWSRPIAVVAQPVYSSEAVAELLDKDIETVNESGCCFYVLADTGKGERGSADVRAMVRKSATVSEVLIRGCELEVAEFEPLTITDFTQNRITRTAMFMDRFAYQVEFNNQLGRTACTGGAEFIDGKPVVSGQGAPVAIRDNFWHAIDVQMKATFPGKYRLRLWLDVTSDLDRVTALELSPENFSLIVSTTGNPEPVLFSTDFRQGDSIPNVEREQPTPVSWDSDRRMLRRTERSYEPPPETRAILREPG